MSQRSLAYRCCVLLAGLSIAVVSAAADDGAVIERGQRDTARFYSGELAALHADFDDAMKSGLSVDALQVFRTQIGEQLGKEVSVLDESVTTAGGVQIYTRAATFEKHESPLEVVLAYSDDGKIAGFRIRPKQVEAATEHLEYQTKTPLRLPFTDEWDVFWGGRSLKENYHTAYPDQRFAYDVLVMRDGATHEGDGTENEQYYCFGLPLVVPGDGIVVSAANDVEDNVPGEMNPKQALGNHVIIDHGNGEFSFIAHIKQGTLAVEVGEKVTAGQPLGLTGNSGNTSEAHVHYHLQTTAEFGKGDGLPSQFLNYTADGEKIERGEPTRGQKIQPR
ncbi:MAG: peptidoglycan DD-metalloendopeptidase family protein [Acidobacteriota bacterium]|nr:peptidoglycan DD-metalloendopeptidase family protein [Acidobacteriota bacterium]MDH3784517.1 peptidoglycan DD-metalloendopeptidase family protein [Acidobacteriota bacterium]